MGPLKENKLPIQGEVTRVCVETVLGIIEADEFGFLAGETLAERANRLDSELESSRGDLGAKDEPRI
jgi:hypothetical protein